MPSMEGSKRFLASYLDSLLKFWLEEPILPTQAHSIRRTSPVKAHAMKPGTYKGYYNV
jgi:hypothetical protein